MPFRVRTTFATLVFTLAATAACNPKDVGSQDGGTDGGDAGGDAGECAEIEDDQADSALVISVRNDLAVPIFVDAWNFCGDFGLNLGVRGEGESQTLALGVADNETCACLADQSCTCEGGGELTPQSLVRLEPGASYEAFASPLLAVPSGTDAGVSCAPTAECLVLQTPGEGSFEGRLTAWSDGPDFDCDGQAACFLVDTEPGSGTEFEATATFILADGEVELVFEE